MGVVVAATHLQLDEPVALKFLRENAAADPESLSRFTREAKAAAKLKSEHVARVLDFGVTEDNTPYIVMEYLEGQDLARLIYNRGRVDVPSAAEYLIQACEGLAEAHARGIVHRDIKPENLFLVDRAQGWQSIKILDFGISKIAMARGTPNPSNIATRNMMGSPCYMSPEQLRSTASVDHRTDIWSLGATLFELLAGRTAYDTAQTLPELITAILEMPTPRLTDSLGNAPPELASIVARCMAKGREERFANTAELAIALMPFAPKRARADVERAIAVTQSAGISSQDLEPASRVSAAASVSNPGPRSAVPPIAPTLASGAPPPQSESARVASTLGHMATVAAPSATSSRGRAPGPTAWAALGFGAVLALALSWALGRWRSPPAAQTQAGHEAAMPLPVTSAAPAGASAPASAAVSPSTDTAPSAVASAQQVAPAGSVSAAIQAPHRPVVPARPSSSQSLGGTMTSPEHELDIRMQR
jgi:serine/threonine-protein kinase